MLESVFAIAVVMGFLTSYKDEYTGNIVKNLGKITDRYLHGNFIFDIITLFPLFLRFRFSRLFVLIKCLRLMNLKEALNVNLVMAEIKGFY